MLISGFAPSATLCLTPRTEAKGLSATARRVTSPLKKWRSAARAWFFGGRGNCELAYILTGQARSDFAEFDAFLLAPGEEPRHGAAIGALRVGVIDRRIEKLVGSEDRVRSSPNQNLGYWPHRHT